MISPSDPDSQRRAAPSATEPNGVHSEAPAPPPGRKNSAPVADVYDQIPLGPLMRQVNLIIDESFDPYADALMYQYPGGGLQSVRGKTND